MLYQTYVKVNLEAIRHNIEGIRETVGPERKILIAVKANAYGHGLVKVSKLAEQIGVNYLGVATVPEGLELRQAGIRLPILKLSPLFEEEVLAAAENQIQPAVCDYDNLRILQSLCQKANLSLGVHLKVDTGMGRIGVTPTEAPAMAKFIVEACPKLKLNGIFTHLPISDIADPSWTQDQVKRFKDVVDKVKSIAGPQIIAHCSNSGAVLGHPEAWMDMVRPGIIVYGYYPDASTPRTIDLQPAFSFYTRVSFIKTVSKGTSIGYGRTWFAPEDTTIATIPVGYADGFNRLWSNKGRVLINGKSYPIVGRVCMDQCMVNLGPASDVKVGEQVVLMGKSGDEEISCYEWAEKLGTITYEVTCQVNSRVTRYYE